MREQIQQLIAAGRTEDALVLLAQSNSDAILLQARYNNGKKQYNIGLMDFSEWSRIQNQVNYALLELADKNTGSTTVGNTATQPAPQAQPAAAGHPDVFISYNHKDSEVVDRIKDYLEKNNLQVLIDREDMAAGEEIRKFIERMIKDKGVILSVVSKNSLRSGWVGVEQDLSFYSQLFGGRQFIPVMIDHEFLQDEFVFDVVREIDQEIQKLDANIDRARQSNIDPLIYETKRRRQVELRENLPKIINRLQAVLTVDVSDGRFDEGMAKVVKTIQSFA